MEDLVNRRRYGKPKTPNYFTITALANGTITCKIRSGIDLKYSANNGITWNKINTTESNINITQGQKVFFKGNNSAVIRDVSTPVFNADCDHTVSGNIMSLLYEDNFENQTEIPDGDSAFSSLFHGNTHLINASTLILPATTLKTACYRYMFARCTSLSSAPELPATTLADRCYDSMFLCCSSLTKAPRLSAHVMKPYCYANMFTNCTSLQSHAVMDNSPELDLYCYQGMYAGSSIVTTPTLNATVLKTYCYASMFANCNNITSVTLPATTLVTGCYNRMLLNCKKLKYIKAMFTTTPGTSYTNNWVKGVTTTSGFGKFIKNAAATWNVTGDNGIPSNWTVQTASS